MTFFCFGKRSPLVTRLSFALTLLQPLNHSSKTNSTCPHGSILVLQPAQIDLIDAVMDEKQVFSVDRKVPATRGRLVILPLISAVDSNLPNLAKRQFWGQAATS